MSDAADRQPGPTAKEFSGRVGKYQIIRPLGRGAMGMVYLAHDTVLERDVALKVMASQIGDDPLVQERFAREARAVAKMTHPNVVTVFELGNHVDGSPYIAMELLKGQDLAKALRTPPPLHLSQKISITLQVLAGLAHAHQAGIIHRDIKPANIFISHDGNVKLMDFGVARLTTASLTGTGNIVGTADYMSPEQVKGAKVDGRSDLFSVGCLLFEMVTGRRPFHADNLMAIFYKITHEAPALDLLPPGPEYQALRPILHKAMAKDLEERYASAYDLAMDLREYLKSHAAPSALEGLLDVEPPSGVPTGPTLVVGDELALRTGGAPTHRPDLPSTAGRPATDHLRGTAPPRVSPTVRMEEPRPARGTAAPPRLAGTRVIAPPQAAEPPRRMSPLMIGVLAGSVVVALVVVATVMLRPRPAPEPSAAPTPVASTAPRAEASPVAPPVDPSAAPSAAAPSAAPAGSPTPAARASASPAPRRVAEAAPPSAPAVAPEAPGRPLPEPPRASAPPAAPNPQVQVAGLIGQADAALAGQKYDSAINLYNDALKLDPQNARALQGRSDAVAARALLAASSSGAPVGPVRNFAAGKTSATSAELRAARDTPEGFDVKPEDRVQRATTAGALPGKIYFDVQPERVKPGDPYKVRVYFGNEGNAPIEIASMNVVGRINGKQQSGAVAPMVSKVAPYDRVLLREMAEIWKEDTSSWQMEVTVRTARGEVYRNEVIWK